MKANGVTLSQLADAYETPSFVIVRTLRPLALILCGDLWNCAAG
jgi:hypothetical protein